MGLFGSDNTSTLEQILGNQAQSKVAGIDDQYTQQKKRLVSQQAASGRLGSGVSNYNLGDLAAGQASDEAGVYGDLASSLGAIPAEDFGNQNDYQRNLQLAKLIGDLNKPSSLTEALGAFKAASGLAGTGAAIFGA